MCGLSKETEKKEKMRADMWVGKIDVGSPIGPCVCSAGCSLSEQKSKARPIAKSQDKQGLT